MNLRDTLLAGAAALTLLVSGCASSYEQPGSAYRTLLICRDISAPQRQTAQQRVATFETFNAEYISP
jgi:hypothetical protein